MAFAMRLPKVNKLSGQHVNAGSWNVGRLLMSGAQRLAENTTPTPSNRVIHNIVVVEKDPRLWLYVVRIIAELFRLMMSEFG